MLSFNEAHAGERVQAGTTLKKESYVFSVEEAETIMKTIQELEFENKKQEELILLYKNLDAVNEEQKDELQGLLDIRQSQITAYEEWVLADSMRIKSLERQKKITEIERWGFFALGIVVTGGAIIVADQLDDRILEIN